MPTIAGSQIPPPNSWDEFEDIILSAAKIRWASSDFFRNGRQGQRQDGVDVFGTDVAKRQIGVQGKNTIAGVSKTVIEDEITKAESFRPPIDALYVATTAKRDGRLQEAVRLISRDRVAAGKFPVDLLFWEDICQDLGASDEAFFRHYPQFRQKADPVKKHDKELFERLSKLLASDGVIGFIDQQNMAGFSFPDDRLDPLREFYYEWNRPEREFITPAIEALRKALWLKADAYLEIIARETFPTGRGGERRWVPAEWEMEQPDRFWQVVKELHKLAGELVALHGDLVRTARSHLVGKAD